MKTNVVKQKQYRMHLSIDQHERVMCMICIASHLKHVSV
jgi:hypothetical protein